MDKEYLSFNLDDQKKEILDLIFELDKEISYEEIQKFNHPLISKLWEMVVNYKKLLRKQLKQKVNKKEGLHNEYDPDYD